MNMLRHRFSILILVFFKNLAYAECESTNVEKLAKIFFTSHRDFHYIDPLKIKHLLTPEFFIILENEYKCISQGELCAIEADPWLSAQDGEIAEPIRFHITSQTSLTASVEMNYLFSLSKTQKVNQTVTFEFQKVNNGSCWLLADFITPKEGSLKKYIQTWQLEYGKSP